MKIKKSLLIICCLFALNFSVSALSLDDFKYISVQEKYRNILLNKSKGDNGFEFHSEGQGRGYVTVYFKDGTHKDVSCEFSVNNIHYVSPYIPNKKTNKMISFKEKYQYVNLNKNQGDNGFLVKHEANSTGYVTAYFKDGTSKDITYATFTAGTPYTKGIYIPIRVAYTLVPLNKNKGDNGFEFHSEGQGRGYVTVYFKDGTHKDVSCDLIANGTAYISMEYYK